MKFSMRLIVEIIGFCIVAAALLFFGQQIRTEQNAVAAEAYAASIESRKADLRAQLESASYMDTQDDLWDEGYRPSWWAENLTLADGSSVDEGSSVEPIAIAAMLELLEFDKTYYRYQSGLVSEQEWNAARNSLIEFLRSPLNRAIALATNSSLSPLITELAASM